MQNSPLLPVGGPVGASTTFAEWNHKVTIFFFTFSGQRWKVTACGLGATFKRLQLSNENTQEPNPRCRAPPSRDLKERPPRLPQAFNARERRGCISSFLSQTKTSSCACPMDCRVGEGDTDARLWAP